MASEGERYLGLGDEDEDGEDEGELLIDIWSGLVLRVLLERRFNVFCEFLVLRVFGKREKDDTPKKVAFSSDDALRRPRECQLRTPLSPLRVPCVSPS